MWTKYLIIKLLCYFSFKISSKETDRQAPVPHESSPVRTTSPTYPSSFTPQCSGIKHPLESVVLLRQSAAHNQLLVSAPSITQLILKKKNKHLVFSGIYKYLPQFSCSLQNQLQKLTAHYVQTLPKTTEEPSRGTLTQHPWIFSWSCLSSLHSPPALHSSAAGVSHGAINRFSVGVSAGRS